MDERGGAIRALRERAAAAEAARRALHGPVVIPIGPAKTRKGRRSPDEQRRTLAAFHAALDDAYPPRFWEIVGQGYDRLAAGEADAVEMAVFFLEADPWFFRSGYVKQDLIRRLKRLALGPATAARLRTVALAAVDGRDRREFRRYCHLARAADAPGLRAALAERRHSPDPGVRRRAEWMLASVEDRPVAQELEAARRSWCDAELAERAEARARHIRPVPTASP